MRKLSYADAICEAQYQLLDSDPRVFLIGQGLWSPWYAGRSTQDLDLAFGRERVIDCPVSENATTGAAVGAAIAGMRPIMFHPRMDFMLLAVDPIVNQAANWSYVFAGRTHAPVVFRAVINRRGEQGAQHSQALQAFFAHVPGLKVVMPTTPRDAKGLLVAAVRDGSPVMYIDDRALYAEEGEVPAELYETAIGAAAVRRRGSDVTIVAWSHAAALAGQAVAMLVEQGYDPELIDLRTLKPWDRDTVLRSVAKTGRLLVVEAAWRTASFSAEIAATVADEAFDRLAAPVRRLCLPDVPAPTSPVLEGAYYFTAEHIVAAIEQLLGQRQRSFSRAA
jgi:pyruvate dehydrogenase E1 component beta subunit